MPTRSMASALSLAPSISPPVFKNHVVDCPWRRPHTHYGHPFRRKTMAGPSTPSMENAEMPQAQGPPFFTGSSLPELSKISFAHTADAVPRLGRRLLILSAEDAQDQSVKHRCTDSEHQHWPRHYEQLSRCAGDQPLAFELQSGGDHGVGKTGDGHQGSGRGR